MTQCDLHIHTSFSDGKLGVLDLLKFIREQEINIISITDHDTMDAYYELKEQEDLCIIPGVEFSCKYEEQELHILAYDVDLQNSDLLKLLKKIKEKQYMQTILFMRKIKRLKLPASVESSIIKARIRSADIKKLFQVNHLSEYYYDELEQILLDMKQTQYLPDLEECKQVIRSAGGYSVLAHPYLYFPDEDRLLAAVNDIKADGLECYSSKHSPEYTKVCIRVANQCNLLITGGSDFHKGSYNPSWSVEAEKLSILEQIKKEGK